MKHNSRFNQLVELFYIEIQHLICNTFYVVLFQFEFYTQKWHFFFGEIDEFVKLVFYLCSWELIADHDSVIKCVNNVLFEILFQTCLSTGDQW